MKDGGDVVFKMKIIFACAALCQPLSGETVRVFILAGQSNMEGKARNTLLDHQATDPETKKHYAAWRDDNGWIKRDDVFIKFLKRSGPLTVGFGSPNCTGPELEFGRVVGDHFEESILLVKAAWGGHSLSHNFRPPSSGDPGDGKKFGESYQNILKELEASKETFPKFKGHDFKLSGVFWFQGFNDQFNNSPLQYEANMKHFITDLRRDLKAPDLPFVIACLGTNYSKPPGENTKIVQDAQLAMNQVPEFSGNVAAFRTDELYDKKAAELFPTWKDNVEEWKRVGSDRPYHYFGSGIWYGRIGKKAGETMLSLMK
ncbi:sialate O-acetylesterase [Akkermansiaceae bacterium]|nr:sialate O-acetylesterase [Akkermansiaceae bacterium]